MIKNTVQFSDLILSRYCESEIRFNLLALVKNKEDEARHQLTQLEIKLAKVNIPHPVIHRLNSYMHSWLELGLVVMDDVKMNDERPIGDC